MTEQTIERAVLSLEDGKIQDEKRHRLKLLKRYMPTFFSWIKD